MAVAIRLSRGGSKKRPYYKIVVADGRAPRDGKYLEQIGTYNPLLAKDDANRVRMTEDRARYWLGVGAQPTDRVARMLDKLGIKERAATSNPNKGEPGKKAKERAEDRASKAAEAAEAAAAAAEEAATKPAKEPAEVNEPSTGPEAPGEGDDSSADDKPTAPEGEATPASEADNQGVSAEAPVEGAVEPAAEEPKVESTMEPAEGAPDKAEG